MSTIQPTADPRVADLLRAGRIRVALYVPQYHKDPVTGALSGWPIDLVATLGERIGVQGVPVEHPNPANALDSIVAGACDAGIIGIEAERATKLDYTAALVEADYTLLAPAGSPYQSLADADRPGVRIAAVRHHASTIALQKIIKHATLVYADTPTATFAIFQGGGADLFASLHEVLRHYADRLPRARLFAGRYGFNPIGMAVAQRPRRAPRLSERLRRRRQGLGSGATRHRPRLLARHPRRAGGLAAEQRQLCLGEKCGKLAQWLQKRQRPKGSDYNVLRTRQRRSRPAVQSVQVDRRAAADRLDFDVSLTASSISRPYSQFNNLAYDPPYVMFSASSFPETGRRKDSAKNAADTGEFVVNMATYELREAVNITSQFVPPEVDEAKLAGLEMIPSRLVRPPRVAASPVHLECKFHCALALPARVLDQVHHVVIGRVIGVHIRDDALTADGKLDVVKIRPLARLGYHDYTSVEIVIHDAAGGPAPRGSRRRAGRPADPESGKGQLTLQGGQRRGTRRARATLQSRGLRCPQPTLNFI